MSVYSNYNFKTFNFPRDNDVVIGIFNNKNIPIDYSEKGVKLDSIYCVLGSQKFYIRNLKFNIYGTSVTCSSEFFEIKDCTLLEEQTIFEDVYPVGTSLRDIFNKLGDVLMISIFVFNIQSDCFVNFYNSLSDFTMFTTSKYIYDELRRNENNEIIESLSSKLNTLDNLNVLASADFTPLLNLSTFADLVGSLNPVLTNQVNALNTLNSYANTLQPVRAKYGQPVPPVAPTTVKLSLINAHNLEITRLDKSKNSICYLTDKKDNLISYFYDIDYSKTIDLSKYSELWLTYAPSDYSIFLQPLIGFDDK